MFDFYLLYKGKHGLTVLGVKGKLNQTNVLGERVSEQDGSDR